MGEKRNYLKKKSKIREKKTGTMFNIILRDGGGEFFLKKIVWGKSNFFSMTHLSILLIWHPRLTATFLLPNISQETRTKKDFYFKRMLKNSVGGTSQLKGFKILINLMLVENWLFTP